MVMVDNSTNINKKTKTYDVGNPGPGLADRHKHVAELKLLMDSHDITEKLLKVTIKTKNPTPLKNTKKYKCKKKDSTLTSCNTVDPWAITCTFSGHFIPH